MPGAHQRELTPHSAADIPTCRPAPLHDAPNSQLCARNVLTGIRLPSTQIGGSASSYQSAGQPLSSPGLPQ